MEEMEGGVDETRPSHATSVTWNNLSTNTYFFSMSELTLGGAVGEEDSGASNGING